MILAAALSGCASAPPGVQEADGPVDVVWHQVEDPHRVCEGLSGRKEFFQILGCSKWTDSEKPGRRVCTIYSPVPRAPEDLQRYATLGHELMHCFQGNWHDRWGRMLPQDRLASAGRAP